VRAKGNGQPRGNFYKLSTGKEKLNEGGKRRRWSLKYNGTILLFSSWKWNREEKYSLRTIAGRQWEYPKRNWNTDPANACWERQSNDQGSEEGGGGLDGARFYSESRGQRKGSLQG